MVLISVIMPSYNHEKFISEAINSVLNQSFEDLELIIVQDSPSENMLRIINSYANSDSRVILKIFNKRLGVSAAFNLGLYIASGEYVAFIGSDDIWLRDKLITQFEYLLKRPNTIVWSDALIIDETGKELGYKFSEMYPTRKRNGAIFTELCFGNFVSGQSMILGKKLLQGFEFDDSFPVLNDYKINLDLSFKYEFTFINKPLVKYRMHRTNLTNTSGKQWNIDSSQMIKYILSKYEPYLPSEIEFYLLLRLSVSQFILHNFRISIESLIKAFSFFDLKIINLFIERLKLKLDSVHELL